ncbi:putative holin [Salinicola sp. JS01]|uniref:putative holin n=1 Tax=Salinicola sp. JS01 TaxID=3050071 RepID=UPI00255BD7DC|nr:putative holin [Salinicola sp. JS01]WIX34941.1 putative holin [Salinicola sp. JS01]
MFDTLLTKLKGSLRLWPCLLLAIVTTTAVGLAYPQQVGLLVWSLTKIFWALYITYWLDRWVFHYARPHRLFESSQSYNQQRIWGAERHMREQASLATIRRAILMAAVAIAVGLGV